MVTTDRKLVRRLRAILEHANVNVNDDAGWALATTSAAVVVEWWLLLIEEQYPSKQFIALANSPFFPKSDPELHHQAINYFEKRLFLNLIYIMEFIAIAMLLKEFRIQRILLTKTFSVI